ncbi:MAG: acyl-CoA dehydrogenase [Rhodobiaceae bacterium]|jgi:(2S)-methylsuccinyl-CoA dehydrogenase|nr:acyl-CoA dehydrogenase [Rhodobiaceae bacterium]MBT5518566.1 acyl-CoA dehydrogenase [Rhodobiaceae bacterium]MBT7279528.1 acyl-CoA dehydrogenase [Rhodobiaceae bacterium]
MTAVEKITPQETLDLLARLPKANAALDPLRAALRAPAPEGMDQFGRHGRAWAATYLETLAQMSAYASQMNQRLGELEQNLTLIIFGEYLNQLVGGLPMSQGEIVRPSDLGFADGLPGFDDGDVEHLRAHANTAQRRASMAQLMLAQGQIEADAGLDETHTMIRDQFRRFADEKVIPHAHGWHLRDELIPLPLIEELGQLGVFGLTVPEEFGGMGLGKQAMCVVSEELSRGYIGVGSLGTRTDIAAELILQNGTPEQKQNYLPRIANGSLLPTAVFTEPNTGSDLASLATRAKKTATGYEIIGAKTWITHGARADVMTLLVRSEADVKGHRGLSMFLAEKPRGDDQTPFPAEGMQGGEIEVLGYRGMKEYDIAFDGFAVPEDAVLGGETGKGFKQLMETFESARIQTAARAIGVAQNALELAFTYATDRKQFGKAIYNFERVSGKLVMMAAEILAARQLTYFAARKKDQGERCDLEAGMAKLLAARVAWAGADNGLQIHGGNGFALEYPISRVLCDARILNIFEGAAEIQADIIARRLEEMGTTSV